MPIAVGVHDVDCVKSNEGWYTDAVRVTLTLAIAVANRLPQIITFWIE